MYGLCDALRAWYIYIYKFMEAVERILSIDNVYKHPLDACLFLVFDPAEKSQLAPLQDEASDAPGKLVATLLTTFLVVETPPMMFIRKSRSSYVSFLVSGCGKNRRTYSTVVVI